MLVVRCRQGETLLVGSDVEIEILEVGGRVKLGVNAPQHVRIVRKGVEITRRQNLAAAQIEAPDMLRIISFCMASPRSHQAGSNGGDLESSKMCPEKTGELTQSTEEKSDGSMNESRPGQDALAHSISG